MHIPLTVAQSSKHYTKNAVCEEAEIDLELSDSVLFLPSINNHQKQVLLHHSLCVLYTPNEEHFGIVPLEAMQYHKPVVACNSGGPKETVIHGVTGFLCENTPEVRLSNTLKFPSNIFQELCVRDE